VAVFAYRAINVRRHLNEKTDLSRMFITVYSLLITRLFVKDTYYYLLDMCVRQ